MEVAVAVAVVSASVSQFELAATGAVVVEIFESEGQPCRLPVGEWPFPTFVDSREC